MTTSGGHTPHLTSLYSTFPLRDPEVTMSRSNSLSTKKFSMYTGLSPKEKIEYRDYNDFRYVGFKKGEINTMKREERQCFQVFILWHGCL